MILTMFLPDAIETAFPYDRKCDGDPSTLHVALFSLLLTWFELAPVFHGRAGNGAFIDISVDSAVKGNFQHSS
jgi:hypothetical protein